MVHLFSTNGWTDYPSVHSLKQLREEFNIDDIASISSLSEKMGLGIDIWGFIDPKKEDLDHIRLFNHFNTSDEAEAEYKYIVESY